MAVTIRRRGIAELVTGPVVSFVIKTSERVEDTAESLAPAETGRLKRSIRRERATIRGLIVSNTIATHSGYGLFPESGTGIYGPTGRVITPRTQPFLVFKPRGSTHVIRVRSVRGQPGQHFMRNALLAVIRSL